MLIEFKTSNYRSIGDEQILSLLPSTKLKDYPKNILETEKYQGLNAAVLYGANASGKSNVLKAIELLNQLLYTSSKASSTTKLPYTPFLLKEGYENLPTRFEISFVIAEMRYRFGVEYNKDRVLTEFLYRKKSSREVLLFFRELDTIEVSSGFNGSHKLIDAAIEATRDNSLFLSTCDMFNVEEAKSIFKWFDKLVYVDGLNTHQEAFATMKLWEDKDYQEKIKNYLSSLNLGFHDLEVFAEGTYPIHAEKSSGILENRKESKPFAKHHIYDAENNKTMQSRSWALEENESKGTEKAFHLSGPLLKILTEGGVLIIDELEAKMHPIMTINTINLFLDKQTNPKQAQIIFATHDTNLLTYATLRRDQINFVEKNSWESTELYALSDFKYFNENIGKESSERIDSDKEKRYLEGRYGAIPMLGSFMNKWSEHHGEKG